MTEPDPTDSYHRLTEDLLTAEQSSRQLDARIAEMIGWRKIVEPFVDKNTGESRTRVRWFPPESNEAGKVPYFTSSLEAAYQLSKSAAPEALVGCSFEGNQGGAKVGRGNYVRAATPAIALCIAVLLMREANAS